MLPGLLWVVLIIGAVVNVGFCLFFGIENKAMHICMVVGLSRLDRDFTLCNQGNGASFRRFDPRRS